MEHKGTTALKYKFNATGQRYIQIILILKYVLFLYLYLTFAFTITVMGMSCLAKILDTKLETGRKNVSKIYLLWHRIATHHTIQGRCKRSLPNIRRYRNHMISCSYN